MMTYDKLSFCVHEVKHKNTTLSPETAPLESRKQNPNCFNSSDKGCCLKPKMRKKNVKPDSRAISKQFLGKNFTV